jgi:hypothetical protein
MNEGDEDLLGVSAIKNGAFQDRGCTDIWCLCIYVLFQVCMGYITWFAMKNGDP